MLEKNTMRKILKLNIFHLVEKIVRFHVDCGPQIRGAFHSAQKSGNFGWFIKWNGPFRFGPTGIFGTSFDGGPL